MRGLDGFGAEVRSLDSKYTKWMVDLKNDEQITFSVTRTDHEQYFHVATIESHSSQVFPGVDVSGTQLYIQFTPASDSTTTIAFGWGGELNGPIDVALIAVSSIGQELVRPSLKSWLSSL